MKNSSTDRIIIYISLLVIISLAFLAAFVSPEIIFRRDPGVRGSFTPVFWSILGGILVLLATVAFVAGRRKGP